MKRFYLLLVCMCLLPAGLLAQMKVKGTVLDENGDGAIGANVVVTGMTVGTVTDFDGQFEINVPEGKKSLTISYLGYKTVTVNAKPSMKVTLETESQQIQEVVVQGMVKQDKRLFTGAATKLEAEETMLSGVADISRSLEGKAAGECAERQWYIRYGAEDPCPRCYFYLRCFEAAMGGGRRCAGGCCGDECR